MYPSASGTRATSAVLHTPDWFAMVHMGLKIKNLTPQIKYITLEISDVFLNPYPFLSCNL